MIMKATTLYKLILCKFLFDLIHIIYTLNLLVNILKFYI